MGSRFKANARTLSRTIEDINNYFKYLSGIGNKGFDCSPRSLELIQEWGKKQNKTLEEIRSHIGRCTRCGLSGKGTPLAFGKGHPKARLMFVGDAPAGSPSERDNPPEDPAAELLTKIIQSLGLTPESVYICHIVKCPTPDGRPPLPEEIGACFPILKQQIQAINPDIICALGPAAAGALLNTKAPVSHLRGKFHDFLGIRVMPTYHPAHLLTNPEKKRDVWEDMKKIMRGLDTA